MDKQSYPSVKITKLDKCPDGSVGPNVNLGGQTPEKLRIQQQVNEFLRASASAAKEIFHLEWEGNKVPRGAVVSGNVVAWTQHGRVVSSTGEEIGTYERLVEFGGASGRNQQMLVFMS